MPDTVDRHKVGTTEYVVDVIPWKDEVGGEIDLGRIATQMFPTLAAAEAYGARHFPSVAGVNMRRGTWTAEEFYDPEYGEIRDAEFDYDESWDGWMEDDGWHYTASPAR